MAIAMIGGSPTAGITGTSSSAQSDRRDVEHRRRERRHEVVMKRVQHAHQRRGDRDERQKRQHDSRQPIVSSSLPGTLRVVAGVRS